MVNIHLKAHTELFLKPKYPIFLNICYFYKFLVPYKQAYQQFNCKYKKFQYYLLFILFLFIYFQIQVV